ncbi:peptidyl-prolyl cis-trans isomerase [Reichenbachiella sp.]|uniref:peptidylprolyl isomerase n=1 Tax=Reichenbachiella sp. TaxID=2184521 RepID=UPI003BB02EDE
MIKNLLKEPLIHFALIGLSLFVLFSFVNTEESETEIVIDEYDLNEIVSKWKLQWQRDPTPQELKGLLDGYIKQEIMYREALAMNLDHNDEIIRRRMAQKVQFLTQDIVERVEPKEEELQAYLKENQNNYKSEKLISFEHIYFSNDLRKDAKSDAAKALQSNNLIGDSSPIRNSFKDASVTKISGELGERFTDSLEKLEVSDSWQGPIESGLGYHLVIVSNIVDSRNLELHEVLKKVKTDYQYDMRNQLNDNLYESLLKKYEVSIELDDERLKTLGD